MTAAEHVHTSHKLIEVATSLTERFERELNVDETLVLFAIRQILIDVAKAEADLAVEMLA